MKQLPTFTLENNLHKRGIKYVAGIDEAGMGAWAGPLAVGAVIMPEKFFLADINDSKKLSPSKREKLYEQITATALAYSVALISEKEIDHLGLAQARVKAVQKSLAMLHIKTQYALLDGYFKEELPCPYQAIIKGDQKIISISAASIIAKVTRDHLLNKLHEQYPAYRFDLHKGYGTKLHSAALATHGPCAIHRYSYAPVKNCQHIFQ